jgi:hypothetical protein
MNSIGRSSFVIIYPRKEEQILIRHGIGFECEFVLKSWFALCAMGIT